ncbi:hypothetical protein SAMN04488134_109122 [Amphibacillus marinus]|uniref:Uncharacterized protein n=1 Tax=Amphibacillus marinus TaxID=872970 RepID=A0A1H8R168_9BACI|nr:hypothetical protein SAMN04488134_109122 [Amphibacillus marinus]
MIIKVVRSPLFYTIMGYMLLNVPSLIGRHNYDILQLTINFAKIILSIYCFRFSYKVKKNKSDGANHFPKLNKVVLSVCALLILIGFMLEILIDYQR